jgi:hypothetical protein
MVPGALVATRVKTLGRIHDGQDHIPCCYYAHQTPMFQEIHMNGVRRATECAPHTLYQARACSKEHTSLLHVWQGRGGLRADQ